jgi:hypothetical protein
MVCNTYLPFFNESSPKQHCFTNMIWETLTHQATDLTESSYQNQHFVTISYTKSHTLPNFVS